ncbi:MAG: hypothetical protein QM640_05755 [Niabella sp.]
MACIRWLSRNEIDNQLWDITIKNSRYPCIYATVKWLDHFSPAWQALVWEDYEAVMPVTAKQQLTVPYLAQPAFTQQLGLFSSREADAQITGAFIAALQKKYAFAEIRVNRSFRDVPGVKERKNHILNLNMPYPDIVEHYSKSLKQNIHKAETSSLVYKKTNDFDLAISSFKELHAAKVNLKQADYIALKKAAESFSEKGNCFVSEIRDHSGSLLSIGLFFIAMKRIYKLITATFPEGRVAGAHHFMIDELVKEYAGTDMLLDFEGSSIPGIAAFNTSFGAVPEVYYFLKWNHLKWPLKMLKK